MTGPDLVANSWPLMLELGHNAQSPELGNMFAQDTVVHWSQLRLDANLNIEVMSTRLGR